MDLHASIVGSEKLISIFGQWPGFHDAEVVWLHLDRHPTPLGLGPTLEAMIRTFQMTSEVDANGYYVLRNNVLVHLRFSGIADLKLDDFNQQNVLFALTIQDHADPQAHTLRYQVQFESSFGLGAFFHCERIEVVVVHPCDATGSLLAPPQ